MLQHCMHDSKFTEFINDVKQVIYSTQIKFQLAQIWRPDQQSDSQACVPVVQLLGSSREIKAAMLEIALHERIQ